MAEAICSIEGCGRLADTRGWCERCYMRWKRHGDPTVVKGLPLPLAERFWAKVNKDGPVVRDGLTPCWVWTAGRLPKGYGRVNLGGKKGKPIQAHRLSWHLHFGPIPDGLLVCHHCDNPPCVNPDHLWLGTNQDNMDDMWNKRRGKPPSRRTAQQR